MNILVEEAKKNRAKRQRINNQQKQIEKKESKQKNINTMSLVE